jgi:hypothetical protein
MSGPTLVSFGARELRADSARFDRRRGRQSRSKALSGSRQHDLTMFADEANLGTVDWRVPVA